MLWPLALIWLWAMGAKSVELFSATGRGAFFGVLLMVFAALPILALWFRHVDDEDLELDRMVRRRKRMAERLGDERAKNDEWPEL